MAMFYLFSYDVGCGLRINSVGYAALLVGLYDLWLYFLVLIGPAGLCICSRCRCL